MRAVLWDFRATLAYRTAAVGWERPNRRIYAAALALAGEPSRAWMG